MYWVWSATNSQPTGYQPKTSSRHVALRVFVSPPCDHRCWPACSLANMRMIDVCMCSAAMGMSLNGTLLFDENCVLRPQTRDRRKQIERMLTDHTRMVNAHSLLQNPVSACRIDFRLDHTVTPKLTAGLIQTRVSCSPVQTCAPVPPKRGPILDVNHQGLVHGRSTSSSLRRDLLAGFRAMRRCRCQAQAIASRK